MWIQYLCLWSLAFVVICGVGITVHAAKEKRRQAALQAHEQGRRSPGSGAGNISREFALSRPLVYAITPGGSGPVVYFANGDAEDKEFQFNFIKKPDSWRAYILRMPGLRGRSESGHLTHRLWDGDRPYVCWDSPVDRLEDMQTVSRVWADSIIRYIQTGQEF